MSVIITHPAVCISGAATGLMTWLNSVIPSLFPFMVLTGLLIRSGAMTSLTERWKTCRPINRLPVTGIFAVFTGILCGYPMGVRTVSEMKSLGQLSDNEARFLYTFVNQPGPMFILGYAMPLTGVKGNRSDIWIISFYGAVLLNAVTSYLYFRIRLFVYRKRRPAHHTFMDTSMIPGLRLYDNEISLKDRSLIGLFEEVLMNSASTLTKIGGYMIIFSMTASLLSELVPRYPMIRLIFCGLLEMTSGTALVKEYGSLSPYMVLGFISFGGLSVAAQSFTLGNLSVKEQCSYLFWKANQAVLAVILYHLFTHMIYR